MFHTLNGYHKQTCTSTTSHILVEPSSTSLLTTLDTLVEAIVSRLLLQVLVPEKSSALAREDTRDPRESVGNTPNSHSNTPLDSKTAAGNALESLGLGLELGGSAGSVHADVDLGVDNVDVQGSEALQDGFEGLLVGQGSGGLGDFLGQVSLQTHAVDVCAVALDELDNALSAESLVAVVLEVVVVVEELGLGAVLFGKFEGDWDESFADGVVEWRRAVGTVLIQRFINNQ